MGIPISLFLLPLLLLCDQSAARSFNHGSVGAESERRDGVTNDIRLREENSSQVSVFERSEVNWTFSFSRTDYPCPEVNDIEPCVCTFVENTNIDLDCSLVASEEQLAAVFQKEFPVKELHKFSMKTNNAITVLGNILNGVTFQSIELSPGLLALEEISESFISDSKYTLTSLTIHNSQLKTDLFPFAILSQMEILRWIDISSSAITSILPIIAPKAYHVSLSYGLTDIIEAGTFSIHDMDTSLYINYNQIVTVEPGSFFFSDDNSAESSEPFSIHLDYNQLQSLQAGTFPFRNAFVNLYLNNNQITSIEPGTFVLPEATGATGSGALTIYLTYNQIQSLQAGTFPIPNTFVELYLYSNEIASIEPGTFVLSEATGVDSSGSLTIDLQYNQLQSLQAGTFPLRNTDVYLYLHNNEIAFIEPGSFVLPEATGAASNGSLRIDLQFNHLQSLQVGSFPLRNAETILSLYYNQIASIEPGAFVLPEETDDASSGALSIYLSNNQLQSLQAGTFPLRNAVVKLYLHSNEIAFIEPGAFLLPEATGAASSGSLIIDLYDNQLQSLQAGTFPLRNAYNSLSLYNNQISFIEPGTFVLPEATDSFKLYLSLSHNQLTTIDEAVFGDLMPFITTLWLSDNPFSCGCDIAWLVRTSEFINKIDDEATCADGTHLHDLDPQFYTDSC